MNDLIGFIVALVAVIVSPGTQVCRPLQLTECPDIRAVALARRPLIWLAKGPSAGSLLQWRVPSGFGNQHLLAVYREIYLHRA